MSQASQNNSSAETTAARLQPAPVLPVDVGRLQLFRLGLGIMWFSVVTVSVSMVSLLIAGQQKLTINGVTTLHYRTSSVFVGLCLGIATSVVLWLISGRYLIPRPGAHGTIPRKRANSIAMYVMVICGMSFFVAAQMDYSARLDADSFEARSLLVRRQIRFDDVSQLTVVDVHTKDSKGRDQVRFRAEFHRTDGRSEEWETSTIYSLEAELRDILQRRQIPFFCARFTTPHVAPAASETEKATAFKQYMQPIVEQQHESLRGSRWRWSVGKEREFETTFEFSSENSMTIDVKCPDRTPAKYSATYERAGEQYRFQFEDGTSLEVTIEIPGGEHFLFGNPVVTGGGSAAAAQAEFTHSYLRQP